MKVSYTLEQKQLAIKTYNNINHTQKSYGFSDILKYIFLFAWVKRESVKTSLEHLAVKTGIIHVDFIG